MYYKKIVGEHLYLSPADLDHEAAIMTSWVNEDQDIAHCNGFYGALLGKEKTMNMMNKWNEGPFLFSIVQKETDEFMGHITLFGIDEHEEYATMGIYLGKEFRGHGFGQEAISLLVDYAFHTQRFHAIHLEVFSYNERAVAAYKKIGFVECGRWHQVHYHLGEYHDIILMELLKEKRK